MKSLKIYLQNTLDNNTVVKKWNPKGKLNLNLSANYEYYLVTLMNIDFLLIKPLYNQSIQTLKTQSSIISTKSGYKVCILLDDMSNYRKQKFIQEKLPFIDLNKQIYIPFIGACLEKEKIVSTNCKSDYKNKIEFIRRKFTPTMQLVYLWILYNDHNTITQNLISQKTSLSPMSISRSLDFFVSIGLMEYITTGKTGRKKEYFYKNKKEFFTNGKNFLINPIKKSFYTDKLPKGMKVYMSGLSALSEQTMLGKPNNTIVATTDKIASSFYIDIISNDIAIDEPLTEVQIMKYDISLLTKNNCVDPITLIYSLEETDDRIEIAIDEIMEDHEWYKE